MKSKSFSFSHGYQFIFYALCFGYKLRDVYQKQELPSEHGLGVITLLGKNVVIMVDLVGITVSP